MIQTSLDVLYLTLAGGLGLLLISLSVLIWHTIGTMKRINHVTDTVTEILDLVNTYVKLPAAAAFKLMKWFKNRK